MPVRAVNTTSDITRGLSRATKSPAEAMLIAGSASFAGSFMGKPISVKMLSFVASRRTGLFFSFLLEPSWAKARGRNPGRISEAQGRPSLRPRSKVRGSSCLANARQGLELVERRRRGQRPFQRGGAFAPRIGGGLFLVLEQGVP